MEVQKVNLRYGSVWESYKSKKNRFRSIDPPRSTMEPVHGKVGFSSMYLVELHHSYGLICSYKNIFRGTMKMKKNGENGFFFPRFLPCRHGKHAAHGRARCRWSRPGAGTQPQPGAAALAWAGGGCATVAGGGHDGRLRWLGN